jgi:hypothetical protein
MKLISKDGLLKVLHNGNKTLADIGHNATLGIINHVCAPKIIARLPIEFAGSKSTLFH